MDGVKFQRFWTFFSVIFIFLLFLFFTWLCISATPMCEYPRKLGMTLYHFPCYSYCVWSSGITFSSFTSRTNVYFLDNLFFLFLFFFPTNAYLYLSTCTSSYGECPAYGPGSIRYLSFFFRDYIICSYLNNKFQLVQIVLFYSCFLKLRLEIYSAGSRYSVLSFIGSNTVLI